MDRKEFAFSDIWQPCFRRNLLPTLSTECPYIVPCSLTTAKSMRPFYVFMRICDGGKSEYIWRFTDDYENINCKCPTGDYDIEKSCWICVYYTHDQEKSSPNHYAGFPANELNETSVLFQNPIFRKPLSAGNEYTAEIISLLQYKYGRNKKMTISLRCPFHNDHKPSATVRVIGPNVFFKCFATHCNAHPFTLAQWRLVRNAI